MMTDDEKTVRVRVAVVVGADGDYSASGWRPDPNRKLDEQEDFMFIDASDRLDDGVSAKNPLHSLVWLEADLPLPVAPTVEVEVPQ